MNVFDFVTQDEIDELPENAEAAFLFFVQQAQCRLAGYTKDLQSSDDWDTLNDIRHSFANIVLAAARRYRIEPFVSMDVPRHGDFDYKTYQQFEADLDHYMTQLVLDSSVRRKRDSVLLGESAKDRIRKYIHGLKVEIDKGNFTDAKRADLLDKLAKFEKSIESRRLNLLEVTMFAMAILGLPGSCWASYEIITKLTTNLLETVAVAKTADDENRRLPPIEKPTALLPPRKEESELRDSESDDEIPF